ncbi:MAG: DNA alkylation repair protein [Betaproteobacteria bacterium]|nr:DNA alkylation repair protein [Betaproteobacteria bacterium]
MAAALKDQFGPEVIETLAQRIAAVFPDFPRRAFVAQARRGFEALDLMARGRHLARVLRPHLPQDVSAALEVLRLSLGPKLASSEGNGMAPFFYLPHSAFVAEFGLEAFEPAMHLQYDLTQRFTAEFCLRPFLERYPERTLERLRLWARDQNVHVRRLVSEGTRPRLPWAPRLTHLEAHQQAVLGLLESLKDDPEEYVRRSVANHLNDLGKDQPELLRRIAARWLEGASPERRSLVRHALRSLVNHGDREALQLLGYGQAAQVEIDALDISPRRAQVGERVSVSLSLRNPRRTPQNLLVDLRVAFVKAKGETRPKVFKLRSLRLAAGQTALLQKSISLAQHTTRTHYAGRHELELLVNGTAMPLGHFLLIEAKSPSPREKVKAQP